MFSLNAIDMRGKQGNYKSGNYFIFWALDQALFDFCQVAYQQWNGQIGNAHWEDKSSFSHCAPFLQQIDITDIIYKFNTGLSEEMMHLKSL